MNKQLIYTAAVIAAAIVITALVATVGDGLRDWEETNPSSLRITDIDIAAEALSEGEAILTIITYIDNYGGPSEDASILVKAFDSDTNLLTIENKTRIGEVTRKKTSIVKTDLRVPKEGGYRLEIVLFDKNKIAATSKGNIQGLLLLESPSSVKLSLREIDFHMNEEDGKYVTIKSTIYIDNIGKEDVTGLRALVKAKDTETRLVVDERWIDLGLLKVDVTTSQSTNLLLLNTRNYDVDVQIWDGQKIVKQGSSLLMLDVFGNKTHITGAGTELITTEPVVKASDFAGQTATPEPRAAMPQSYSEDSAAPGFEAFITFVAISSISVLLINRRRGQR
ncbi:MAG: hypothetical protein SVK08_09255 [Halobacteriota archaeon]|nr:hypothetical protein [Halobacteriota archaeon]